MHTRRRQSGYILLLVLVTLALTSMALATVARVHLQKVVATDRAEQALQQRWATLTVRETVLPNAHRILRDLEAQQDKPVPVLRANFVLDGRPYQIVLADEQAKLNVNAVYQWGGESAVTDALKRLAGDDRGVGIRPSVIVPPAVEVDEAKADGYAFGNRQPIFASFGQLYPTETGGELYPAEDGASPVDEITCWGFGRVNFRRASEAVLREACRSELSAEKVSELVDLRNSSKAPTVEALLTAVGDRNPRMSPLSQRLIDESWCYSLWIATSVKGRMSYDLTVRDEAPAEGAATYRFSWTPRWTP